MIVLQIDITDIEDAKAENNRVALDSILSTVKEVLAASGRVVLKRSYCNAPDDIFRVYSSAETFEREWGQWFSTSV